MSAWTVSNRIQAGAGGGLILAVEAAELLQLDRLTVWATPVAWTGYLFLIDAVVARHRGHSFLRHRFPAFARMAFLSIVFWVLFDVYNLRLHNWAYLGLPANRAVRWFGYAWSFATVLPGVLLTFDWLRVTNRFAWRVPLALRFSRRGLLLSALVGLALLTCPFFLPAATHNYLFGPVWFGFIFLLEPLNYHRGKPSLYRDLERGEWRTIIRLAAAGLFCGFLWEFWNYGAAAHWVYTIPWLEVGVRLFQMPVIGFFGFVPFAWKLHALYYAMVPARYGQPGLTTGAVPATIRAAGVK